MIIAHLIKEKYRTVKAYHGTKQVRQLIASHGSALVVVENERKLGIITAHDLATKQHNLVIDCLTPKPILSRNQLIPEVLLLMQDAHSDILMVYDEEILLGVVHKKDITDYLCHFMEQQKTLVHSIAHDLKNPLSNVLSITYLLESADGEAENRELIALAQDACKYAHGIINDLLFSEDNRNEPLRKESVNLNEIILDCIDSFKIGIQQKTIELTLVLPPERCKIEADQIKIKRALSNLLSNAIKFTPSGGKISVVMDKRDSQYRICVRDNGIGISPDLQDRIFQKFTDAKRPGTNGESSTGLGMHITKQIIEGHGGKLWLESEINQGTAFFVELNTF